MTHSTHSPSMLPERALTFSPTLAQTIGLEQAVLLQALGEISLQQPSQHQRGYDWLKLPWHQLGRYLPFWTPTQLLDIAHRLQELGLIVLSPEQDRAFVFAMSNNASTPTATPARPQTASPATTTAHQRPLRPGAQPISNQWTPSEDILQLLTVNHSIPLRFALSQVEDFKLYWQSRGEASYAWDNKFRQRVLDRWRDHQQREQEVFQRREVPLDRHWQPDEDALHILLRAGISRTFIDDTIPEFVLYWREREHPQSPNAKFVNHVRNQWTRYTQAIENEREPKKIPVNWQPKADVYDILQLSHIDIEFARGLIPEFILYWTERGDAQASWSSRFLQHVKYHWAKMHQMTSQTHERQQKDHQSTHTRARSLDTDLSDRSWAQRP